MGRIDPLEFLTSLSDAAFATDESEHVVAWNSGAEQLLGHTSDAVLGRPCFEILCGRDVFGNRFCDADCSLTRMARRHESIRDFDLDIRTASGASVRVDVRTVPLRVNGDQEFILLHILRPRDQRQDTLGLMRQLRSALGPGPGDGVAQRSTNRAPLSRREIEVLRLLAQGQKTRSIATLLNISQATSRNHVQNILRKMDAHSQLEAVAVALHAALI